MVQINLLPATAKKKHKAKVEWKFDLGPPVFALASLMILIGIVWVILGVQLKAKQAQLAKLDMELSSLQSILQKVEKLKEEKARFTLKLEFMDQQLKREILWAKNLNRLSNLVPSGIWLKNVILHSEKEKESNLLKYKKLDINGSVVSLKGEEMIDLIGRLMTAIKNDEVFAEQFSKIELISSQRSQARTGKIEIMDFKLICQFK